jgi:hypothetical protein
MAASRHSDTDQSYGSGVRPVIDEKSERAFMKSTGRYNGGSGPGKAADLHMLRAMLEAGRKYETAGHTMICQKAFPPRWEGDHGRESRAQCAVNIWRLNSKAQRSVERLHDDFLPGWKRDFVQPMTCRLENMKTGDVVEVSHKDRLQAWLIAILKVLISAREKEEGTLCVGCGRPAIKTCGHDCGEAPCGAPVCSRCQHIERNYKWYHSGPLLGN